MELYTEQLQDAKLNIKYTSGGYRVKGADKRKYKKSKPRCLDIFTFDVENTNAWLNDDGEVIGYEQGHNADYWNSKTALSLVYIWQFSYNNIVFYGRELEEFLCVLDDLPKEPDIQIFVHNLDHELCFLRNILTVKDIFARGSHSPIKVIFEEYPNITFRCTYAMTNMSLDMWGKQIGIKKLVGDLDYNVVRTPLTELTDIELGYCERDCIIVYEGIKKDLETYGTIYDIPMTSTGRVRRATKKVLYQDNSYNRFIKSTCPDYEELQRLMACFSGGVTHCNRIHADVTLENLTHFDFCSSYPTVLCSEKMPFERFRKSNKLFIEKKNDNFAFMYKVRFSNIESVNPNTYIQLSKAICTGNVKRDNGRLIRADECTMFLTDNDMFIIQWLYKWKYCEVIEKWFARKEYLPSLFIDFILTLYANKTELKGIEEKTDFYQQQKAFLNSLYGMCVTKLCQPEFKMDNNGEWYTVFPSKEETEEQLNKLKDTTSGKHDYFVSYSWGVWCTSYARLNLYKCILGIDDNGNHHPVTHNGYDVAYYDTDSIFTLGNPDYNWYNEEITEKIKKCCSVRRVDFAKTQPKDIKGIVHPLGIFDQEEPLKRGKFIHAKCYLEQRYDDKYYMTISGINKSAVSELGKNAFENFTSGFEFSPDGTDVHKLMPIYNNDMPIVKYPDGYVSTYLYGKTLRPTGYKINNTDEYQQMIDAYKITATDITDGQMITFKNSIL